MEVERDDAAETESQRLGIVSFVRHGEALSGLFQQRYCDFHVHELERPGEAVQLCSLPGRADVPLLPDAAAGIDARVLQFVLYKENRTTSDALQQLASAASIPVAALRVAGTKDRRAITVQRCSWLLRESVAEPAAAAQQVARLLKINSTSRGSRVRVGHLQWAAVPLRLGDSMGNRFSVVLRELALAGPSPRGSGGSEGAGGGGGGSGGGGSGGGGDVQMEALSCACAAAVASVRACGFVNYFGLQRFGSGEGEPTQLAGANPSPSPSPNPDPDPRPNPNPNPNPDPNPTLTLALALALALALTLTPTLALALTLHRCRAAARRVAAGGPAHPLAARARAQAGGAR